MSVAKVRLSKKQSDALCGIINGIWCAKDMQMDAKLKEDEKRYERWCSVEKREWKALQDLGIDYEAFICRGFE